ncbi:MAG: hypothetical protein K1X83_04995 [Oligoflexia bacterium]|nr:hypothetical protein [Oligoflexia bacterium]
MHSKKISLNSLRATALRLHREQEEQDGDAATSGDLVPDDQTAELLDSIEGCATVGDQDLSIACDHFRIPYVAHWEAEEGPAAVPEAVKKQLYGKRFDPGLTIFYDGKQCLVTRLEVFHKPVTGSPERALLAYLSQNLRESILPGSEFQVLHLIDAALVDFSN